MKNGVSKLKKIQSLLLTGAAGTLGTFLRPSLGALAERVRLGDIAPIKAVTEHEEAQHCDLSSMDEVLALTQGMDCVVHLGGCSDEAPFEQVLSGNLVGLYNLYESCRQNSVQRVVLASSNHVVGYYSVPDKIDEHAPLRPDSIYGVSKAYGEALAQLYWDKFAIETVSMRIGSCVPKPVDPRMLRTWLSPRDFIHLVERSLLAENVGHTIVYGVSDNPGKWWRDSSAQRLGYAPKDNAEHWSGGIGIFDVSAPILRYHGGNTALGDHPADW